MTPFRRLLLCALTLFLAACSQAHPDLADSEPIKPDLDPWERVGSTMAKKQAAVR